MFYAMKMFGKQCKIYKITVENQILQ